MGKKNKKQKKEEFVLPEGAQWATKDHSEYWMSLNCGHCGRPIHFQYDEYGILIETRYWHLSSDGGRIPYCDGSHSFYHHEDKYKIKG